MAENEVAVVIRAKDEASKVLDSLSGRMQSMSGQLKIAGAAMVGVGVAITGFMALAVKQAGEQEVSIMRLSTAMRNMGLSYEQTRGSLEAWVSVQQRKTGVSDEEQRDSLAQLVTMTGDLTKSQNLLTLAMDLSAGKGLDLATASMLVGRVATGNTDMLTRYGIVLKEGTTATEALAEITRRYGGQAEAMGKTMDGQIKILKASFSDLMATVGENFLPMIKDMSVKVLEFVEHIKKWTGENPELVRQLTLTAAALGALNLVMGTFILLAPQMVAVLAALNLSLGVFGVIVLTMNWLVVAIIEVSKWWRSLVNDFASGMSFVANIFLSLVQMIVNLVEEVLQRISAAISVFSKEWGDKIYNASVLMSQSFRQFRDDTIKWWLDMGIEWTKGTNKIIENSKKQEVAINSVTQALVTQAQVQQQTMRQIGGTAAGAISLYGEAWAGSEGRDRLYAMLQAMAERGLAGSTEYMQLQKLAYPDIDVNVNVSLDSEPIAAAVEQRVESNMSLQGGY